jgi:hypothetical protein
MLSNCHFGRIISHGISGESIVDQTIYSDEVSRIKKTDKSDAKMICQLRTRT